MRRLTAAAFVLGASIAVADPLVFAQPPNATAGRPLSIDLVPPAGGEVTGTRFPAAERWVLVYVAPNCGSCDRLLAALTQWRATLPAGRIAVVVEGDAAAARRYADERGIDAAGFAWYADVAGAAARELGLQRLPAAAGLERGGEVSWSIDGVLNQPDVVEPAIRRWLTQ